MPIRKEMQQRYPKDWALRSRFVRFYRAGNRCEWCGVHNYSLREDTGAVVVLTAAHVYDKRPEACGLLNLAALCQRCHLRHDAKDRAQGQAGKGPRPAAGAGDLKRPFGEQPPPGDHCSGAGEDQQLPRRAGQPERRSQTALPDRPPVKGRRTPAEFPAQFPTTRRAGHQTPGSVELSPES